MQKYIIRGEMSGGGAAGGGLSNHTLDNFRQKLSLVTFVTLTFLPRQKLCALYMKVS